MNTFQDFAQKIGFNIDVLDNYITFSDCRYNSFYIAKKKKSKKRIIDSPSNEIKAIQRWLLHNCFEVLPISPRANGFVKTRGIKRNALTHLNTKFILVLDIKDFFPTITQGMVYKSILPHYPNKDLAFKISKICTYKRKLPQGAPTSPYLSNLVFRPIDDEIVTICNSRLINYSRYADDLTFSSDTKNNLVNILPLITQLLNKNGFKVNNSKTKFYSGRGRMNITGININENRLTVSKSIKRKVRSQIFNYIIKKDISQRNKILGYLSFIRDIEPNYYIKMQAYSITLKKKLARFRMSPIPSPKIIKPS